MAVGYENTCTGTVPVIYLWHILNHHHLGVVVGGLSCGPWERIIFPEFHLLQLDDMSGTAVRFSWCGLESARKLSPPWIMLTVHLLSMLFTTLYGHYRERFHGWGFKAACPSCRARNLQVGVFIEKFPRLYRGIEPEILTPQPLTHLLFNKTP